VSITGHGETHKTFTKIGQRRCNGPVVYIYNTVSPFYIFHRVLNENSQQTFRRRVDTQASYILYTIYICIYIYRRWRSSRNIIICTHSRAQAYIYIYLPHFPPRESSVFITAVLHIYADTCGYNTYLYSMYVQLV